MLPGKTAAAYLQQELDGEYLDQVDESELDTAHQYRGSILSAMIFQAADLNLGPRDITGAARKGGLWGLNICRVDDILDGENGFSQTSDPEGFLDRYVETVEKGEMPANGEPQERSAYRAGQLLHQEVEEIEPLVHQLNDMQDMFIQQLEEDGKDYERRLNMAGMTGEAYGLVLDSETSFEADTPNMELCFDTGVAGQVLDDLRDQDHEPDREEVEEYLEIAKTRLKSDGVPGNVLARTARYYSGFGDVFRSLESFFT